MKSLGSVSQGFSVFTDSASNTFPKLNISKNIYILGLKQNSVIITDNDKAKFNKTSLTRNNCASTKERRKPNMFKIKNFEDNNDVKIVEELGAFKVVEYLKDLSVDHLTAQAAYYASEMNVRRRQLVCDVSLSDITVQSGAMQWMVGNVSATTGLKGVGDFLGKALRGKVTNESAIKPEYTGTGKLVLEPTYKHILLIDVDDWNGSIVIEDGLFLACDSELNHKAVMKSNLSSAAMGGEGLFNLGLSGGGIVALESYVPREELIEIELENDELKIDGNMAIAWSGSLEFTVSRSGQTLLGSAASGEGLVNVYRGTGKVLMAPVLR
jgi:uncharacterized protein (AIM24 family)